MDIVDSLEDHEKKIIKLYFGLGDNTQMSQATIAKMFNIEQPMVSKIIAKSMKKIKLELIKNGVPLNLENKRKLQFSQSIRKQVSFAHFL